MKNKKFDNIIAIIMAIIVLLEALYIIALADIYLYSAFTKILFAN